MYASRSAVGEAPNTSLDELMFDHLAFVMQEPQLQEDCRVSRQRVYVLVLLSMFRAPPGST